ncbi:hypothetical protein Holit_03345 [Hollandina sp. SP2]
MKTRRIAEKTSAILSDTPDALETILKYFETSRIVFIGEATHRLLNTSLFVNHNLQRFYDAGVRYILGEGGKDGNPVYSDEDLQKEGILLFYPWEYVGVRYKGQGETGFFKELSRLNRGKEGQDTITYVGLESGRTNFADGTTDTDVIYNYRDAYMAEMAFEFIDKAAPHEKFLISAGGAHGVTEILDYTAFSSEPWKPLGAYLKEKYGDDFISLYYTTLDGDITGSDYWKDMLESEEWQGISNTPKMLTLSQAYKVRQLLPISYESPFDGYIVEKSGIIGVMYSYALYDPVVLKEVIKQMRQYDGDLSVLLAGNAIDYTDAATYVMIRDFLTSVYYLKLWFGDYFPYDFWNPQMPLREALSQLEAAVLADGIDPAEKTAFLLPSMESLREYHVYIEAFASSLNRDGSRSKAELFRICEPYMKRAFELFPYELWTPYWYVKMYTELKEYGKAYEYIQTLLADPLIYAMQIYPETLELAALCAEQLGDREQAEAYRTRKADLRNEYGIDVHKMHLFLQ